MRQVFTLFVSLFAFCIALLDEETVTKYATEVVYVCSPTFDSMPLSPASTASVAYPNRGQLSSVDIYNDFDIGDLMVKYTYEKPVGNLTSVSSNISTSVSCLNGWNSSCLSPTRSNATSSNASLTVNHVVKREGAIESSWQTKEVTGMQSEFAHTIKTDDYINELNDILSNSTFLGGVSTYMHVVHGLGDDLGKKENLRFKLYEDASKEMWHEFYKNNDEDSHEKIAKTKDASNILILLSPNYYSIQTSQYQAAREFIASRLSDTNFKEKDGMSKVWGRLDADQQEFVKDLATDDEARNDYVTFMINVYYEYGVSSQCEAGDSSCRILDGWGALMDKDFNRSAEIAAIAAPLISLFGFGIPLGAIYGFGSTIGNAVPVSPEAIQSEVAQQSSYSSVRETAASTEFTTSVPQCTATYAPESDLSRDESDYYSDDEGKDPSWVPERNKNKDPEPDEEKELPEKKPAVGKYKGRKFENFCDGSGNPTLCNNVMKRHLVQINMANPDAFDYGDAFVKVKKDAGKRAMWGNDGETWTKEISSKGLPVYVVNAVGQSPGVACNALKFIARNYYQKDYFAALRDEPTDGDFEDEKSNNGMMAFVRGPRYERRELYDQGSCQAATEEARRAKKQWALKSWKTKKIESLHADEFPPYAANVMLLDKLDVQITCVPEYDNILDGKCWQRFLGANSASTDFHSANRTRKGNPGTSDANTCASSFVGILDYTDKTPVYKEKSDQKMKNGKREALTNLFWSGYKKFKGVEKSDSVKKDPIDKSAFIVVVNTLDTKGEEIDCSKYSHGTAIQDFEE